MLEQATDFFVRNLRKIIVPKPHSAEWLRRSRAHNVVRNLSERLAGFGGSNGHCDDHSRRTLLPQGSYGCLHGRAGCESIVDENDGLPCEVGKRPVVAVKSLSSLELRLFHAGYSLKIIFRDASYADQVQIKDTYAAACKRSDCQFFLRGQAEFSDDEHIERNAKRLRDLECDWHTASWKCEDDDITAIRVVHEVLR